MNEMLPPNSHHDPDPPAQPALTPQKAPPSPNEANGAPAAQPAFSAKWLRSITSANGRIPARLASGLAYGILALIFLLEVRQADVFHSIPFFYLIPLALIAWFSGYRSAVHAGSITFVVGLAAFFWLGRQGTGLIPVLLMRLIAFASALLIARGVSTARLMLDFVNRGADWRAAQDPVRISDRLLVVPVLNAAVRDEKSLEIGSDVVPLYIRPGMAFGTSSHPTTRMCLELLENFMQAGATVLDVGCGTGILAIAAAKLGAEHVHATEIDPQAVRVAHANLELNQVSDRATVQRGSLDALESGNLHEASGQQENPSHVDRRSSDDRFDLILANLPADVILELLQTKISGLLGSAGVLVASGIRKSELGSIEEAAFKIGLRLVRTMETDGWSALAARWK